MSSTQVIPADGGETDTQTKLPDSSPSAPITLSSPIKAPVVMKQASIMRLSTASNSVIDPNESIESRNQRILERREVFKWLPIACDNDLVHGSWWYVWGSFFTILIPVVPLISLYVQFWPITIIMDKADHSAAYLLLCFMGIFYSIGSWVFIRTFKEPAPPPLVSYWYFANDELFGTWFFVVGTLPSVPVMAIYCWWYPQVKTYRLALCFCVVVSAIFLVFILVMSPFTKETYEKRVHEKSKQLDQVEALSMFSNVFKKCVPSAYHRHISNDWLIVCWFMTLGSLFSTIISIILAIYYAQHHEGRGVYDWVTSAVDMFLFTIGSMYLVAGSYPKKGGNYNYTSKQNISTNDGDTEKVEEGINR